MQVSLSLFLITRKLDTAEDGLRWTEWDKPSVWRHVVSVQCSGDRELLPHRVLRVHLSPLHRRSLTRSGTGGSTCTMYMQVLAEQPTSGAANGRVAMSST